MAGTSPIFVVGLPRSGTTLVSMVLNTNSTVCIAPETHYYDQYRRKCERRGCLAEATLTDVFVRFLLDVPPLAQFDFSDDDKQVIRSNIRAAGGRTHGVVLGSILEKYAQKEGKTRYGEKTPTHVFHVDEIMTDFPEAQIVYVQRDPRDVSLSMDRVAWRRGNLVDCMRRWRTVETLIQHFRSRYEEVITTVSYEAFVRDPEQQLRLLCDRLALPYEANMLAFHRHGSPNFDLRSEPWKAKNVQPIDSTNTEKWRAQMHPHDLAIVESRLGRELREAGYPLSGLAMNPRARVRAIQLHLQNTLLRLRYHLRRVKLKIASRY